MQLEGRSAGDARHELDAMLKELRTDYIDVATYYYVEHEDEWRQIITAGGAAEAVEEARRQGKVRSIGLTSHQRKRAAKFADSGRLDLLMVRYNAAHRGAEQDVFPTAVERGLPIVAFTCLRWGALLRSTPRDPAGFAPPPAREWYRWVLSQPAVSVALMAPSNGDELRQNLALLDDWRSLALQDFEAMQAHGERVRRHAPSFP